MSNHCPGCTLLSVQKNIGKIRKRCSGKQWILIDTQALYCWSLVNKTCWRICWFTKEAIPMFLLATFAVFLLDKIGILSLLEKAAAPILTRFLGLPPESVQVAIMKMIRKESGGAMLKELSDAGVFDNVQIVVALLLLAFLLPCVNSIFVMVKERGLKLSLGILAFVMTYALTVGATVNFICRTLGVTFK